MVSPSVCALAPVGPYSNRSAAEASASVVLPVAVAIAVPPWKKLRLTSYANPAFSTIPSLRNDPLQDGFVAVCDGYFRFQTLEIAADGREGERLSPLPVGDRAVVLLDRAAHVDPVEGSGMSEIADRYLEMVAPEERHGIEGRVLAQQVARDALSHPLRHHPVLDADGFPGARVGKAGIVAGGPDARSAGAEVAIDDDALVDAKSGPFRESQVGTDADAHHCHVGGQRGAVGNPDHARLDGLRRAAEVEDDAVRLVHGADVKADLAAEDTLHGNFLGRDDVYLEAPGAQGSRGLEADEAGADHHGALRPGCRRDDLPRVRERAEGEDVRQIRARDWQPDRYRSRGENDRLGLDVFAILEAQPLLSGIERDGAVPHPLDALLSEPVRWPEGNPFLGSASREVVLGQVRAIRRSIGVRIDERDRAPVPMTAKHLGGRESSRAAPDDGDRTRAAARLGHGSVRKLFRHPEPAAVALDAVPGDGKESGRRDRLSRTKVETGMVPGAADGVADDQALPERTAVVGATCSDGDHVVARAAGDDGLSAYLAGEGRGALEARDFGPLSKIGALRRLVSTHDVLSCFLDLGRAAKHAIGEGRDGNREKDDRRHPEAMTIVRGIPHPIRGEHCHLRGTKGGAEGGLGTRPPREEEEAGHREERLRRGAQEPESRIDDLRPEAGEKRPIEHQPVARLDPESFAEDAIVGRDERRSEHVEIEQRESEQH